jgi:N-acetylglutamate synthase-like GNAT family acetyltransferase
MTDEQMLTYFTRRPASPKDIDFVHDLFRLNMELFFRRYTKESWSESKFEQGFKPERITIIEDKLTPVAFYDVEPIKSASSFLYLRNLQIIPGYQNHGHGNLFIGYMEEEARKLNLPKVGGKVFTANERALRWLQSIGYRINENINLCEESSVWVEKHLI